MRAIKYFLFFGGILLALVPANAFAVVDITLQSVDSAKVSTAFDVEAHLYGVDTVGAVTLTINFDQNKVQITSITSDINGVIIPGVNAIENANATGKFTIPYASTTGFVPGDDTVYATITCMTTAVGNALFEIDSVANVKDTVFPPNDITGANTNKTVSIVAHGDATKFVIIDPADTDVDTGATVTIQLQDIDSIVCTGADDTQVMVVVDEGTIIEDQPIAVTNGVATIHMTYHEIGVVNISLNDSAYTGYDVSSTQDVAFTVGTADKLIVSAAPTTLASNALATATVTATITDQYGNKLENDSSTAVTFTITDATHAGFTDASGTTVNADDVVTTEPAFAENGVATIYITSASGAVETTKNFNLTATSGTLTPVYPSGNEIAMSVVDFSLVADYENILTGGTATFTVYGAQGESDVPTIVTAPSYGQISAFTYNSGAATFTATYTAGSSTGSDTITVNSPSLDVDSNPVTINIYNVIALDPGTTDETITLTGSDTNMFSVSGGDENYTWTVISPDGLDVSSTVLDSTTGNRVIFTAPNTGDYGEYTITVYDTSGINIDGTSYKVTVLPIPARITGTVKVGNFLLTQSTDNGYTIKVTNEDGVAYNPAAEDTDGLDGDPGLYIVDVPIYDDCQPGGASLYETAVIHIYIGDSELTIESLFNDEFSVENGEFSVGDSNSNTTINIEAVTEPPIANAGTDQTVDEGVTVYLDGSNSFDPDDGIVSYSWTQTNTEAPVTPSDPTAAKPTFTSPNVGVDGEALTFELEVTDTGGQINENTDVNTCIVNVTWVNVPPIADAGTDQTVDEGVTVTLDGLNSSDPDDGDSIASYSWTQTNTEAPVTLSDPTTAEPTFTSPDVGVDGEALTFELEVADTGGLKSTDTCIVNVTWVNVPPTADAGTDQTVDEGVTVYLDGSNSYDSDDGITLYRWEQTAGTSVTLSDPTAAIPTFVGLPVDADGVKLTFQLNVSDNGGLQTTDEVSVTVNDNGITGFPADVFTFETSTNENAGVKIDSGGNITSLNIVDPDTMADTTNMPNNLIYGLIDLRIKTDTPGETVKVTVYLSEPVPDDYFWYKYGPNTGWYDFTSNVEFNPDRDQVTLTLVDGGAGDDDGLPNSVIVDPSGPGTPSDEKPVLIDNSDDERCFIATSAYGSPFESHVKILRNFRDVYLMPNRLGHAFVDTYYKYSPAAAAFIADHEFLKAVVRVVLMPVVGISYAVLHTTAAQKMLIIFLICSFLSGSCLAIRRLKTRKTIG